MIEFKEKKIKFFKDDSKQEKKSTRLNTICRCKNKCEFKMSSEFKYDDKFTQLMSHFFGYRHSTNEKRKELTDFFNFNDTICRNMSNHLKLLNADQTIKEIVVQLDNTCWSNYNQLINFLHMCDGKEILASLNEILKDFHQIVQTPSRLLNLLNEKLFNFRIKHLCLRLGTCKRFIF